MKPALSAPVAARVALLACLIAPAAARAADAEPPIVVTGSRPASETGTSETVDSSRLEETTAVLTAEDSLRYLPSLLVRRRHVGDTQAPLATRTSGVGASARSLIYADGVLLSALIGNNNSTASPRWGMVSPEEIDRVELLYGPFSPAYPGNSIGAVVNITTRLPDRFGGSLSAATSVQGFSQYGQRGFHPAFQLGATVGDRLGRFAWFASANHVAARSQPLAYVTIAQPAGAGAGGTPVTGAVPDRNRAGAPIFMLGAGGLEEQRQDNLKLRLAFEVSPALKLGWRSGLFLSDTRADARTWLSGGAYAGALNIGGKPVNVPAAAFSSNVYRLEERHWMHAVTAEGEAGGVAWRAIASLYDYDRDVQRIPSVALPAARSGGAGSILDMSGTGWRTLDLQAERGGWRAGAHYDRFELRSRRYSTADWRRGDRGALVQASEGVTRTAAVWAQDEIRLGPAVTLILGARQEWWRAADGFNLSLSPPLSVTQPRLDRSGLSPKATLHWVPGLHWSLALSAGQANRFPTVSELYQAVATGPSLTVPDPHLRPERARSGELAVTWSNAAGRIRLSLFGEAIRDALISQTAPLVPGSTTLFSYVQNVPRVRTRGIELVVERRLGSVELSGSLTLADPKVVKDPAFPAAEGKDLPQVPRRRATFVATWHATEQASLTLAGRYSSRSFGTIDNSDPVTRTFQGFDGYFVLDSRANFRLAPHWDAALGVENLTDTRYFIFHPFPGRTATAELTYRW
jgi:iron complex outermembrane receptor protein